MDLARLIVNALENKKGEDIVLLDLQGIADFTDFFVICTGTSDRMLSALAESAVEEVKKVFEFKGRREGTGGDGWLLVDFGDVILHLFSVSQRNYYQLEDLWNQGKVLLRVQ